MIGDKQRQESAEHSVAIQSGNDTTINTGLSTDQMRSIIECVADQLPKYAAIAATLVDGRLRDFEEKIIGRFGSDEKADTKAFEDPDFQYLLRGAQHAFARSGEADVAEQLTELIAERSKARGKTRKALSLNRAIETAPLLTENEIAELTLSFAIRRVCFNDTKSPQMLGQVLQNVIAPLIPAISTDESSYIYMESLGCGKISIGTYDLTRAISSNYREAMSHLPLLDSIIEPVDRTHIDSLIAAGLLSLTPEGGIIRAIQDEAKFAKAVETAGLSCERTIPVFNATQPRAYEKGEIVDALEPWCPSIQRLFETWDDGPLKNFDLSSVGVAIGFINLRRTCGFSGNIDIWLN